MKFPKHTKRINSVADFVIYASYISVCIFILSITITVEHNTDYFILKKSLRVWSLHHESRHFYGKGLNGNFVLVCGPNLAKQQ